MLPQGPPIARENLHERSFAGQSGWSRPARPGTLDHVKPESEAIAYPATTEIPVSAGDLIVLVGASGSGKSRFACRNFSDTEILSSDRFRAMISDSEDDQSVSQAAFDLLYRLARLRLSAGRLTVVDATSATRASRKRLTAIARATGSSAVAIVFELPLDECVRRDAARLDRSVGPAVIERQFEELGAVREAIAGEDFDRMHVLAGAAAIDAARVVRTR